MSKVMGMFLKTVAKALIEIKKEEGICIVKKDGSIDYPNVKDECSSICEGNNTTFFYKDRGIVRLEERTVGNSVESKIVGLWKKERT